MSLTKSDKHYWHPIKQVLDHVASGIPPNATVLEIGPGALPFPRATAFVDFDMTEDSQAKKGVGGQKRPVWNLDLTEERLPFPDKTFDFIYCRHLLEDSWNPFAICAEMSRVGKRGYIETPSPFAELARGVDGDGPVFRGYHHHRFIVWSDGQTLNFVTKYPIVEFLGCPDDRLDSVLRSGPHYWNTFFPWEGSINVRHIQSPQDFNVGAMDKTSYAEILNGALRDAEQSIYDFCVKLAPLRKESAA